jgi:hypothetical protein
MKNLILALLILTGMVHAQSLIVISGSKTVTATCNPPATNAANDWTPVANAGGTGNPGMTDSVGSNTASQVTSGDAPTYSATGAPNSTPDLTFNGSSDFLSLVSSVPYTWTTYSGYVVFKTTTCCGSAEPFLGNNANGAYWHIDNYTGVGLAFGIYPQSIQTNPNPFTNNTWVMAAFQWNTSTGSWTIWQIGSGSATVITSGTQTVSPSNNYQLNSIGLAGTSYFNSSIAEIALYNGTINTSQLASYGACKYGF